MSHPFALVSLVLRLIDAHATQSQVLGMEFYAYDTFGMTPSPAGRREVVTDDRSTCSPGADDGGRLGR